MKKFEIVKEHHEFDEIIEKGKYIKSNCFIIYNNENKYNYPRFGIAVGKKVGNAVIRNKLKRQYRMIITNNKNIFKNNQDYIIIVKRSSLEKKYHEIEEELKKIINNR